MNIFDEALVSLQEAIEYERGDKSKGRSIVRTFKPVSPPKEYNGDDIRRIREANKYTQEYLGAIIGVSLKCVQAWEYNRSKPNGSARRIITLIEKGEDFLMEAEILNA